MESEESCFICTGNLSEEIVIVSRGMEALISASRERNDGHFHTLRKLNSVKVHPKCRAKYTLKREKTDSLLGLYSYSFVYKNEQLDKNYEKPKIEKKIVDKPIKKKKPVNIFEINSNNNSLLNRINNKKFSFANNCFICGLEASKEKEARKSTDKRKKINFVKTKNINDNIIKMTNTLDNKLAKEIRNRIITIDLVAKNAKYHQKCYGHFCSYYLSMKNKKNVPLNQPSDTDGMEKVFKYIEENEGCKFTYQELSDLTGGTITRNTVRKNLIKKYGQESIRLHSKQGSKNIITIDFTNSAPIDNMIAKNGIQEENNLAENKSLNKTLE